MNLRQYIDAVKDCKKEDLYTKYGIYDNYPIMLKWNLEGAVDYFRKSGCWQFRGSEDLDRLELRPEIVGEYLSPGLDSRRAEFMRIWDRKSGFYRVLRREDFSPWFGYTHGHVVAQFQERPWNINNTNYTLLPNFSKHYKKMKKYNCFIMLHPHNHQGTTRPVPSALYEGLAHVAGAFVEIAEMILREKIPACFPYSIGEFKIDTKDKSKCSDMSKIVYYNPKTA